MLKISCLNRSYLRTFRVTTTNLTRTSNHFISQHINQFIHINPSQSITRFSTMSSPDRTLLMIPGPTEYEPEVLARLGEPSMGHTSVPFINEFSECLKALQDVHVTTNGQPFILSGSGTLGWDLIAANLCESGDKALLLNTGYFSSSFVDCLDTYGVSVSQIKANKMGESITADEWRAALQAQSNLRLVVLTQVDTSTAVLNDIKTLASIARSVHPDAFIAVDGVCSFGGEEFLFDEWNIDAAMSCSQKALGAPPGLCTLVVSQRALEFAVKTRKSKVPSYFANLSRWLPIMQAYQNKQPAYFATPNVNLIRAFRVSLQGILSRGLQKRWTEHRQHSAAVKSAFESMNLKQVPTQSHARANTLSAFYYPENIDTMAFLKQVLAHQIAATGGLNTFELQKTAYFRVGHMGTSVRSERNDVERVVKAVGEALNEVGYKVDTEKALQVYRDVLKA